MHGILRKILALTGAVNGVTRTGAYGSFGQNPSPGIADGALERSPGLLCVNIVWILGLEGGVGMRQEHGEGRQEVCQEVRTTYSKYPKTPGVRCRESNAGR